MRPKQEGPPRGEGAIVETRISIPGLMPGWWVKVVRFIRRLPDPEYEVVEEYEVPDNLDEKLSEVAQLASTQPWLTQLMEDVRDGKRSAVFKVTLGALVVFAAVGTGVKFGLSDARDLRELYEKISHMLHPDERS